ncbi:LysR family transcriptional regulator [Octadecabacter sp. G9-8]|uniref:LysR family transcriptional regulator n=1 Tax=Octadecabacter dasysiphoniae TaxID=2909341 RepID=A0ABS9CUK6_9RHOB|nr:LysR family transcriptional regulator [Octadecabacter dasysiphoniae]MCF2870935.1 LysR family transcriptional regulator [Octadecabacter dasysiphoniae]
MIGNVLNIKQLEALVWVAELGSFRKAAHHLGTTQPNISSRISGLEKTLGVVVMQRDAGSIQLTDKGREILAVAHKLLRNAEEIVQICDRPDLVADRLRLGVTELVACTWLHAYLRAIKAAYPSLNVELTVDLSRNLDSELRSNRLDIAIQTAPFASAASGVIELGTFPYIWVATPQIASALVGPVTVADLLPHTVLTHARHTQAYGELVEYAVAKSLPVSRFVSSSSLASCVQMAADGMGVTLLPKALVEKEIAEHRLIEVDVSWTPTPLRFAARYQSERAALYLTHCAQMAADAAKT